MNGNILVIFVGIPIVVLVIRNIRDQKLEWLMSTSLDKFTGDIDCLNQIMTLQDWQYELQKNNSRVDIEIKLKGFINDHF
jgi:hypothetical protein